MTFHQLLAEWSQRFWPLFANHLWQATLFALVVWVAALWLKRARSRHILWLMAFAKFLLPSALLFLLAREAGLNLSWPARMGMTAEGDAEVLLQIAEPVALAAPDGAVTGHNEVYCGLTALWLVGAIGCFARWRWRRQRLAADALAGDEVEARREAAMLESLKLRLNVKRPIKLVVSSRFAEPVVWGAMRPVIILPGGIVERLSDDELEPVLKHEIFHVERFDNLLGSLQMFVCCLFWFHPLVWLIDRKLIEERELICDERVILSGAAPDAYAASLWKVVQFSFGWPVRGVSRAAGSSLKRRIKVILNAGHQSKSSTASRALAGITFVAFVALAAAMALFTRDGAAAAKAPIAQDQKFVATAPMRFENPPDMPVAITGARLSAAEARLVTGGGADPGGRDSHYAVRGEMGRDVEFFASLVNQSDRRVTGIMVEIQNPSFWGSEPLITLTKPIINSGAQGEQGMAYPQQSFAIETEFPLQEKKDNLDLIDHLYDFNIRVRGVRFESDDVWLMAQPGKTPGVARGRMVFNFPDNAAVREKKDSAGGQDQSATDSIQPRSGSLRPTILYREKAQYTREARDNKVEGAVVLSVVFGADGQISGVRVIRGLPYGLTEKAIEAAKKIRFEPAMKDGQPVSAQGNLEFYFRL